MKDKKPPKQYQPINTRTFYWYFRPIGIICKLFAAFPIQNIHYRNSSKLAFRFGNLAHLYSVLVFLGDCAIMVYFTTIFFEAGQFIPGFVWKALVIYMMIARSMVCFLFCNTHCQRIISMLRQLETYDIKRHLLFGEKERYHGVKQFIIRLLLPLLLLIGVTVTGFALLASFIFSALPDVLRYTPTGQISAIFFGVLGVWQLVPLSLYIYFATVTLSNLKDLNKTLCTRAPITCLCELDKPVYNEDLPLVLENIRHLYTIMSSTVKGLNVSYGKFLAIDQLALILLFTCNLYVFFFTNSRDDYLISCTMLNAIVVLVVIDVSHHIKEEAMNTADLLQKIFLSNVNDKVTAEIQTFLTQMAVQPIHISAAGFFVMDRKQVSSILASVATYMIVLIQYTPQLAGSLSVQGNLNDKEPLIRFDGSGGSADGITEYYSESVNSGYDNDIK